MTWLVDNFMDFSYLNNSVTYTGNFFDVDISQSFILSEYTSPLRSSIVSKTSYWSVTWLNLTSPIVEGDNATITAIFYCDSYGGVLDDYTLWSVSDGVFFNDTVGKWDTMTWTQTFDSIVCDVPFDVTVFQSQQLFDIKMILFFSFCLFTFYMFVKIFSVFFWFRK
jgi:hypothetical protein